jgi:BRCT domain type II-containing protein
MARKTKQTKRKSNRGEARTKARKKTVKRAASKKTRKTKPAARKRFSGASKYKRTLPRKQTPGVAVVENAVIDIVDEPLPGVVRVTEIEETDVALPDEDEED